MLLTSLRRLTTYATLILLGSFSVNAQNQALDLSGAGNEVNVTYNLNNAGFTVEYWVYFPSGLTTTTSILNQTSDNIAAPLDAYVNSDGSITYWIGDGTSSNNTTTASGLISANTWHHIAFVYDPAATSSEGQLFLDGNSTAVHTLDVTFPLGNIGPVRIGRRGDIITPLEGDDIYYDEIRIWNSPRSGAQISANYDTNLDPATTGLDVYLKFDSSLGLQDFAPGSGDQSGTIAAGSVAYTPGVSLQNNALNFDGTDDVVDLGSVTQFNIGTTFTFETWINLDSYPSSLNAMVFNKWQSGLEDKIVAITPSGSVLFSLFGTSVNVTSPSSVPLSQWVHIAASYDGVNANIYINGALDASAAASGDAGDGTGTMYLGGNAERSPAEFEYLDGSLDEVRLWNIARTQAEIHANAYSSVSPSGALTAYYDFNINSASGDNTGATNLYDAGGTGLDGTLEGPFALTGSSSNWVTSNAWDNDVFAPLFDVGFPSVSDITTNSFDINSSANESGLVYGVVLLDGEPAPSSAEVKAGTGQGGSPAQTFFNFGTNATANDVGGDLFHGTAYDVYLVAEDFEPNIQSVPTKLDVTTLGTLNNTLAFDGADDYVAIPDAASLDITSDLTIETWVKFSSVVDEETVLVSKWNPDATPEDRSYLLQVSGTSDLGFAVSTDGTTGAEGINFSFVQANYSFTAGRWYHIAGTYSPSNALRIYVNGELIGENITNIMPSIYNSNSSVVLGANGNFAEVGAGNVSTGVAMEMDETRIWSLERSQQDIQNDMFNSLVGSVTNLNASYTYDYTSGTTLSDDGSLGNNGILNDNNNGTADGITAGPIWGNSTVYDADVIAPFNVSGYPVVDNITEDGFDITTQLSEIGVLSYVVLPDGATVPGSDEVRGGTDGLGTPGVASGTINIITPFVDFSDVVSGLSPSTNYDVYMVAEDLEGVPNVQINVDFFDVTTNAAPVQNALDFDGTDDYVIGTGINLASNDFTVEAWFNTNDVTATQSIFSLGNAGTNNKSLHINLEETQVLIGFFFDDVAIPYTVPTGWHHIAVTHNATTRESSLYIDGQFIGSGTHSGNFTGNSDFTISRNAWDALTGFFNGQLDELRVWNDIRSETEIALNRYVEIDPGPESNLVAYYQFNEASGTLLPDSKNSNDGTWNGSGGGAYTAPQWISSSALDIPPYIVTNTDDSGTGSLRDAITYANANPGTSISFLIDEPSPWQIDLSAALPSITAAGTIIDGITQPGWVFGDPNNMVTINGSSVGTSSGIEVSDVANVEIYGLIITGFSGTGSTGAIIINGENADGAVIGAFDKGNIIHGNTSSNGIYIVSGDNATIQGNWIGTLDGTSASANGHGIRTTTNVDGLLIGGDFFTGEGNVISGAGPSDYGIQLVGSDNVDIRGNLIGTNATGTGAIPNLGGGISLESGATFIAIGGPSPSDQNIISGNNSRGIYVLSATDVDIDGNLIGLEGDGISPLGNTGNAILLSTSPSNINIGLQLANKISYNDGYGIFYNGLSSLQGPAPVNEISCNTSGGIGFGSTPDVTAPTIDTITPTEATVSTTAADGSTVTVWLATDGCSNDQGVSVAGTGVVSSGQAIVSGSFSTGEHYTAYVEDVTLGTSPFSSSFFFAPVYPIISSISPISAEVGASVTITGTDFNITPANNIVWFGATRANVTGATSTELTVTVPSGAKHAPIAVLDQTTGLLGNSNQFFNPIFSPSKGTIEVTDFDDGIDFPGTFQPSEVTLADIDGDGKPDIIQMERNGAEIGILLNNTSGNTPDFAAVQSFQLNGSIGERFDVGDIDGDGKLDIVGVSYNNNTVSVLRNTSTVGSVSFATAVFYATPADPLEVALGDLDGDGKLDMVVAPQNNTCCPGSSPISVYRNTSVAGSISFDTREDIASGAHPVAVTLGDLDGDGMADVIVANANGNSLYTYRNISTFGDIQLGSPLTRAMYGSPTDVALGDMDKDGKLDIILTNGAVSVYQNTSSGPGSLTLGARGDFTSVVNPGEVAISDLNGDDQLDIISSITSNISILQNTSSGVGNFAFDTNINYSSFTPSGVTAGDIDGDEVPDLVATNAGSSTIRVIRSNLFDANPPSALVTTEVSPTQIDLSWTDNADNETDFAIFRSDGDNLSFVEIGTVGGADITTYSDNSVTADNNYFYYVVARNGNGDSDPSNEKAAATFTSPGNALTFDGVDDGVEMLAMPNISTGASQRTFEVWFKATKDASTYTNITAPIIRQGDDADGSGALFSIAHVFEGGVNTIGFWGNNQNVFGTTGEINLNQWYHVAAVFDGSNMDVYLDGSLVLSSAVALNTNGANANNFFIGTRNSNNFGDYFQGEVDEVRIWNTARTETEIRSTLNSDLVGNEADLVAYYKFDQTDPAITVLPDRSNNQNEGTLTNFGGVASWNASGALAPVLNYVLDFDGVSSQSVVIPDAPAFDHDGTFTYEAWVKPNTAGRHSILAQFNGAGTTGFRWLFLDDNGLYFQLNSGGVFNTTALSEPPGLPYYDGLWHHVAIAANGPNAKMYFDGEVIAESSSFPSIDESTLDMHIGSQATSGQFNGQIDEVRFWDVQRSDAEIFTSYNTRLIGNEANLLAYYNFNDGINSSLARDAVGTNDGVLTNMDPATDWVYVDESIVPIKRPSVPSDLIATRISQSQIDLFWTDNSSDETDFAIFRSDGDNLSFVEIATVGSADITTYSDNTVNANENYFYYVIARNAGGDSAPSNEVSASTFVPPGYALQFDNTDYLNMGTTPVTGTGPFTIEAWFSTSSATSQVIYTTRYSGGFSGIYYLGLTNTGQLQFAVGDGTAGNSLYSVASGYNDGNWHHVAAVREADGAMNLYVDGALDNTRSQTLFSMNAFPLTVGRNIRDGGANFIGELDELAIWSTALTAGEISADFAQEITDGHPQYANLERYYHLDHTSGTVALEATGNGTSPTFNGTFAWVPSGAFVTAPQQTALNFSASNNDFVSMTRTTMSSGLTYEAWIRTNSTDLLSGYAGNPALTVVGDADNNIRGAFGIHDGRIRYTHYTGSWEVFDGTALINDGGWHHIAVTHDQSSNEIRFYVDGVLDYVHASSLYDPIVAFNRIGGSYNDGTLTADFFDGDIDNVRIWDGVVTEEDIRSYYLSTDLTGHPKESDLLLHYTMDQGDAGNDNSGITTLNDQTGGLNGTLNGFILNGTISNFISSSAFDHSGVTAPATQASNISSSNITDNSVDINWTNGDGMRRIVAVAQGTGNGFPSASDQIYYHPGDYGTGDIVDGTWEVVYSGFENFTTINGLSPGTEYEVAVLEINGPAWQEAYNINTATDNPITFTTTGSGGSFITEDFESGTVPSADYSGTLSLGTGDWTANSLSPETTNVQSGSNAIAFNTAGDYLQTFEFPNGVIDISFFVNQDNGDGGELEVLYSTDGGFIFNSVTTTGEFIFTSYEEFIIPVVTTEPTILRIEAVTTNEPVYLDDITINDGGPTINFSEDFDIGLTATTDPSFALSSGEWLAQGVKSTADIDPNLARGSVGDAAYMFFGTGNFLISPYLTNVNEISFWYKADPVSAGTFDFEVYGSSDGGITFDNLLSSGSTDGTDFIEFAYSFGSPYNGPIQIIYTGGGSESGVIDDFTSDGFASVAPTLSGLTPIDIRSTDVDFEISVDVQSDLYYVVTFSTTAPDATQILAGLDELDNPAVTSNTFGSTNGTNQFNVGGLDPATNYYIHWVADNGGLYSNIATYNFVTADPPVNVAFASVNVPGGNLTAGSTDNLIYALSVTPDSEVTTIGFILTLDDANYDPGDFPADPFTIWMDTDTDFAGATPLGSFDFAGTVPDGPTVGANQVALLFAEVLPAGVPTYLFVTADIAAGASPGNSFIPLAIDPESEIGIEEEIIESGTPGAGNLFTIQAGTFAPPNALAATDVTSTEFTANWEAATGAIGYFVDVATDAAFTNILPDYEDFDAETNVGLFVSNLDFRQSYYYRVRADYGGGNVSANSSIVSLKTDIDAITLADSLALVQIYDAISPQGLNWESARLRDWDGVVLNTTKTRVRRVDFPSTGAVGEMPNPFAAETDPEKGPLDMENALSVLSRMTISNNEITGLMDFAPTVITNLNVSGNSLEFDDLEPLIGITTLDYSNQASIQFVEDTGGEPIKEPHLNSPVINVNTGGTQNVYTYFRNGIEILGSDPAFDISNGMITIKEIDYENMGEFSAEVTSTAVPGLTISVDPQIVYATANVTMTLNDVDGNLLSGETFDGALLETIRRTAGYDTLERAPNVGASFIFNNVVLGDYLCGIDPENRDEFIPTYFGNAFEWELADVIELRANTSLDIRITEVPPVLGPGDGEGSLEGLIEEDFGDEEGRLEARRRAKQRKCGLKRRRRGGRNEQDDEFELIAYGETDDNGEFQFGFLPQGTYRFFVEYPGIPLDDSAFVEFEVGEAGVSDTDFKLQAFATEDGIEVTIEAVLGIILEYFKDLTIYPNPSNEYLNIQYRHLKSNDVTAQLVDLAGNTLWSSNLRNGFDGEIRIDVTGYEEGMYILRFYDRESPNDNVVSFRVIVKE